jgi:hypothetical protein
MTAVGAWRDGVRRVARAPLILAGVWLITTLVSLPLMLVLRREISTQLGASLAADPAATGVNYEWMQQFADQATGIGTTLTPSVLGFGVVLDNLSAFLDEMARPVAVAAAATVYLSAWLFMLGGILDRYARDRATGVHGFFSAAGVFFFRFLRLGIVMLVVYGLLFGSVHPWLFGRVYPRLTRNVDLERTALLIRAALYAVFILLLAACNLIVDYAKVRAVVEDRRSMIGALISAVRFMRRNLGPALALYGMNAGLFAVILVAYDVVAPGAGGTGWTMWAGFTIAQLYIVARLALKLVFWGSETALFQSRLAHAGYIAAAAPAWPDSPAAEAIQRAAG